MLAALDAALTAARRGLGLHLGAARAEEEAAAADRQKTMASAADGLRKAKAIAGNRAAQTAIQLRSAALEAVRALAPGAAGSGYSDEAWFVPVSGPQTTRALRIGAAILPRGAHGNEPIPVPLLVPFLDEGNLVLVCDGDSVEQADATVLTVVARVFAAVPAGQATLRVFDPNLRSVLAPFTPLKAQGIFAEPARTSAQLEDMLEDLARDIAWVAEQRGGALPDLGSLNRTTGQHVAPYRLLVVSDFPAGFTERAFDLLAPILERGSSNGVHVLLQRRVDVAAPRERRASAYDDAGMRVELIGSSARLAGIPGLQVELDDVPPPELLHAVCTRVERDTTASASPALPFMEVAPPVDRRWSESSADGLVVVIGRAGTHTTSFTLGDSAEQLHNVLIGGAVGQGKSNLLSVIIHGLAARYPPDELEMYLLDLKEGLEFNSLVPGPGRLHGLPHAAVVGVDSDRHFARAVLRHLTREFDRRARLFKEAGARDVARYRAAAPDERMPRLLLVIDEFQVLFERDDPLTDECVALVEKLARKGRAYGIHMVLATQTLSGIQALVTKESSIFGQFPVRIALRSSATESQVLLGAHNVAAAELRFRGEAVLNTSHGALPDNRRTVIAHASDEEMDRLRGDLWRAATQPSPPIVFRGGQPADFPGSVSARGLADLRSSSMPKALLGVPVGLDRDPVAFEMFDEPGRHLAIIGAGGADRSHLTGLLAAILASLAWAGGERRRFIVLDLVGEGALARASDLARRLNHEVEVHDRRAAADAIRSLESVLRDRREGLSGPQIIVIALGLHRAVGLETPDPISAERPVDVLRVIVRDGPLLGMHLIGWWGSYKAFEQQIEGDYTIAGIWQGYCFLQATREEVTAVLGPFAEWDPVPHRALLYDRADSTQELLVPFGSLDATALQQHDGEAMP